VKKNKSRIIAKSSVPDEADPDTLVQVFAITAASTPQTIPRCISVFAPCKCAYNAQLCGLNSSTLRSCGLGAGVNNNIDALLASERRKPDRPKFYVGESFM